MNGKSNLGSVVSVRGSVVDIRFDEHLPAIYTVLPGAIYYSRTFMPDTTMVFFLTAALFAAVRFFDNEDARS